MGVSYTNNIEYIFDELEYSKGIKKNNLSKENNGPSLIGSLAEQTFGLIPEIDAIYFSGHAPLIYFKSLANFDPAVIQKLHLKVWNQGRVPLLFVTALNELRIYNGYQEPLVTGDNSDSIQIDRFENAVEQLDKIKATYHQSQLDSGLFWSSAAGKKINASKKVDQLLVNNLIETRKQLYQLFSKKVKNTYSIIHNLLGRSLFILYLEDRKVITPGYYGEFLSGTQSYFDLLKNKRASYNLYKALNEKFNGDLFTVTKSEMELVSQDHLELVRKCFYGNQDVKTGQMYIWRLFDFSYIPIELISSIYEEFLHKQEGEEEVSNQGAYYTPLPLVEFVLNEVLPLPDQENTNYKLKILDPACGSGIFLVEAYRRLIERWKFAHPDKKIGVDDLRNILKNSIFGVEKNGEAIKVASFSLYLTILNYLEPKSIWTKVRFPHLIQSEAKDIESQGANLFHSDTFETDEYATIKFDLVIGNPPWKRGGLSASLNKYIQQHALANEAVLPFLHKMAHIAPDARIALVSAAKILFNMSSGYDTFRAFLFNQTKVDCIVNFSALRKSRGEIGRKLFASATGPTMVLFYNGINNKKRNESIVYCVPKPQVRDSALNELIIDASDFKFIPLAEASNPRTKIWKVAMWGTSRDMALIQAISKKSKLIEYFKQNEWSYGNGFQTANPSDKPNSYIHTIPHVANKMISRYYTPKEKSEKINTKKFRRFGCQEAYQAPHILIKRGQKDKEFCASYIDFESSFKDGVYGVYAKGKAAALKALTGYFNSTLSTYYLFLTSSSWGVEREQVFSEEVFNIPAPAFLDENQNMSAISVLVDKIIEIEKNFSFGGDKLIDALSKKINNLILQDFNLTDEHRLLLTNMLEYSLDFFQDGAESKAILPVKNEDLEKYVKTGCSNLQKMLTGAETNFWAKTYVINQQSPLSIVSFHFNHEKESGVIINETSVDVNGILKKLNNHIYEKFSESIYFRKVVKYYDGDVLFMVKPNEKRFWAEAMALEDTDTISMEMIVQDNYHE